MLSIALLLLRSLPCWTRLVNTTIDDMYGDARTGLKPEYAGGWQWISVLDPPEPDGSWDASQLHNATLHFPSLGGGKVSLTFNGMSGKPGCETTALMSCPGTAIYVFVVNVYVTRTTVDAAVFYMDGGSAPVGHYGHYLPDDLVQEQGTTAYNVLAFKVENFVQGKHRLVAHFPQFLGSYFDYAVYAADDGLGPSVVPVGPPSTIAPSGTAQAHTSASQRSAATESLHPPGDRGRAGRSVNLGLAVGVPAAGVLCASAVCAWYLLRRRRRRQAHQGATDDDAAVTPFTAQAVIAEEEGGKGQWIEALSTSVSRHRAGKPPRRDDSGSDADLADAQSSPGAGELQPSIPVAHDSADVMSELERVRAESAQARSAYESVRAEIQMLRQALEPPPYPVSEAGTRDRRGR